MSPLQVVSLALCVGIPLAVHLLYRRDIAAARRRIDSGSTVIQTASGQIEYASVGQGRPLLSIHGTGGGFDQGLLVARQLGVDLGEYRIVAPSRYGYLRTPLPDADVSPTAEAGAHASLLDSLGINEPIVVAGASAGALSAMQFALLYPSRVAALILLVPDSWLNNAKTGGGRQQIGGNPFIVNHVLQSDFALWVAIKCARRAMLAFIGIPPDVQRHLSPNDAQVLRETLEGILPVSRRFKGILKEESNHRLLQAYPVERIIAPTLIIDAADVTTFAGSSHLAATIPNAELLEFASGGHLLVGHQAEVHAAVKRFLTRHACSPTASTRAYSGELPACRKPAPIHDSKFYHPSEIP